MVKKLWDKWIIIAEKIGNFQATVIFSFIYFLLTTPLGIVVSLFRDFLGEREPKWQKIDDQFSTKEKLRRQ